MDDVPPGVGVIAALLIVIAVSVWLGALAQRKVERGSFLQGFFLGNRGLGVWALALTATVQSGGTFIGFPSLVYSHGWIIALWIAGYMVVPITGFALVGKRMAQLSRRTGAITVPDMLRERFASPTVGLVSSLLIIVFMTFMLVAQFKAGALVIKHAWPGETLFFSEEAAGAQAAGAFDGRYLFGLLAFSLTVVGYTLIGGFLASVWTDLFQSVLMACGVVLLVSLALPAAGGLENATRAAIEHTSPAYASGPGYAQDGRVVHPLGLAFSFFVLWVFTGVGSPASLVRLMASEDSQTIRRSIVVLSLYNMLIYLPLIAIAVSAHAILPLLGPEKSDEMIPRMAIELTRNLPGGSLLGGLVLAAPFGAVMATVSTYLVVIASGLVRDVYQRMLHPEASERAIRRVTHLAIAVVGGIAIVANIRPVDYLQAIVVFSTTGGGSALLAPALFAAYWRRATAAGVVAAMLCGASVVLALYVAGWVGGDPLVGIKSNFRPYFLLGVEPVVWGLVASFTSGIAVSLCTQPPDRDAVSRLFDPR